LAPKAISANLGCFYNVINVGVILSNCTFKHNPGPKHRKKLYGVESEFYSPVSMIGNSRGKAGTVVALQLDK
jgi:hypothetical protein